MNLRFTIVLFLSLCSLISTDNVSRIEDFHSTIRGFLFATSKVRRDDLCSIGLVDDISHTTTPPPKITHGNCSNKLTEQGSVTRAETGKVGDESRLIDSMPTQSIVTFDEWTKEKLKHEQRKPKPATPTVVPGGVDNSAAPTSNVRNYASKECGAKILSSNAEAENTKALLNDKEKDEYMRNPCDKAENKFVVIELCETIQPRKIELGNFELFSSGPRDVRVWAAERFPNGEWTLLGNLTAGDTRQVQSFPLAERVYAKFVKLELVSHYGTEHYCTLSVFKVSGISMVDEYEIEAEAAVRQPPIPVQVDADPVAEQREPVVKSTEPVPKTTEQPNKSYENPNAASSTPPPVVSQLDSHLSDATGNSKKNDEIQSSGTVPDLVQEVVNGGVLKKIVNVVKEKLVGSSQSAEADAKRFDFGEKTFNVKLCHLCPVSPSQIVPTHFCWAFMWREKRVQKKPLLLPSDIRRPISRIVRRRHSPVFPKRQEKAKLLPTPSDMSDVVPEVVPSVPVPNQAVPTTQAPPSHQTVANNKQATESIPAATVSHKESVFMKLNKRIAALELNMSLSSEYLSELSRQYVAQTDEHKKHWEQAKRMAQEVAESVENRLNETISDKLLSVRKELDTLSAWLSSMRSVASDLVVRLAHQKKQVDANEEDQCASDEEEAEDNEMREFFATRDGFWTTEQVVYAVLTAQILTVAVIALLVCFTWLRSSNRANESQLERIIEKKVEELMKKQNEAAIEKKKLKNMKKRQKRKMCDGLRPVPTASGTISDASTSKTWPTETSSEAESGTSSKK